LPEDHSSGDRLRARVPFVEITRLHDAVLPLFEEAQSRTQRRPPRFSVCGEQPSVRRCDPVVQGGGTVLRLGDNVLTPFFGFYPVRAI